MFGARFALRSVPKNTHPSFPGQGEMKVTSNPSTHKHAPTRMLCVHVHVHVHVHEALMRTLTQVVVVSTAVTALGMLSKGLGKEFSFLARYAT
jgi:hypothetical protein